MKKKDEVTSLNSSPQKCLVPNKGKAHRYNSKYDPDTYPDIAYQVLSSAPFKSLIQLATALDCCRPTINEWRNKYPEFSTAVNRGLAVGAALAEDVITSIMLKPTTTVNNSMIKLRLSNVYQIREDSPTVIINNTNNNQDPEEEMKKRGIPLPDMGLDIELDDEYLEEDQD